MLKRAWGEALGSTYNIIEGQTYTLM